MDYTDQTGNTVTLKQTPKRIISLVPSQSEFLWDIGLQNELIGITKFCIHPDKMFRSAERVGGTKKLDIEKIRRLKPDLIIGNKEENQKEQIELLQKEFPVWMSDIFDLNDAFEMMTSIAEIVKRESETQQIVKNIKREFAALDAPYFKGKRVVYLIWYDPVMVTAKNTFVDHVLAKLGCVNAFNYLERYPEVSQTQLRQADPDIILLSSEPFPFKEKHVKEFRSVCPDAEILLVDGEMFSWYGSRLQYAPAYFRNLVL
jgi:ABC-type Fe3+-hydroxamate transport system substrate-binding protein